ncbi:MAG: hypothetical protein FD141_46 [Fusobacteria bacterium]|nr:MAG: hypothetical protein FD141_46 [Fusobacteriota bacterium]KAF0229290.1 MAG: hypothetical protein FD182_1546 [Fusobacteriota bacterium]
MTFYLLFFGLFIYGLFVFSYRLDFDFKSNKKIFSRFRLKKGLRRYFLYDNKKDEILIISYILQILGYILILISIVLSYIFAINDRNEESDFYRFFGISFFAGLGILTIIFLILYIIDKKES